MNAFLNSVVDHLRFEPDGVTIISPLGDDMSHAIDLTGADDGSVNALSQFLYCHFHAGCRRLSRLWLHLNVSGLGKQLRDPAFLSRLRAANPGTGYLDPGWFVTGHDASGGYHVEKDGLSLFIENTVPPSPPALGTIVPVKFPGEVIDALPGFCIFHGDQGPVGGAGSTRIYLHLKPEFAPDLIGELLGVLLKRGFRYTLKVINNPAYFSRRDNCVLYIRRRDYDVVARLLLDVCARRPAALGCDVPGLTFRLRDGIGIADSPAATDGGPRPSFGQHRMHVLATTIIEVLAEGARSPAAVVRRIHEGLTRVGIDPDRPWLATAAAPGYSLLPEVVTT